jgi:hypothetical protein
MIDPISSFVKIIWPPAKYKTKFVGNEENPDDWAKKG